MKKRSKHSLSHYRLHTAKMGQLFPIACVPVIPGDTIQHHTSALVRAAPLNTPVMHPVQCRIHHFFVPNRLTWPVSTDTEGWENFITGGKDGNNTETVPTVSASVSDHSVYTYLGVPFSPASNDVNALPLRAFNMIYNEYFRDQDLAPERTQHNMTIPLIAWEKDYFTTARPWSQKGPEVTLPVGTSATVYGSGTVSPSWETAAGQLDCGDTIHDTSGGDDLGLTVSNPGANLNETVQFKQNVDQGLYADLANANAVSINQFRAAFALQRYQEARARYGSRFTEYLRYLGITPSDARLQRPEYLGGGTTRLNFSEVLQTTPGADGEPGVGDLYGHGIAGVKTNKYRRFFEEHGYIITVMSVRPKSVYYNAVPREFLKQDKEDFYQQEFVNLGQQEILGKEVNIRHADATFGYQDRYDEYRQHPSQIGQDFRTTLSSWHLARDIDQTAVLNQAFVECDPSDRIFQVQTGDNLWIMINHRMVARRLIPSKARPRIL